MKFSYIFIGVLLRFILFLFFPCPVIPITNCKNNLNCSLNGKCKNGICICDKPWGGSRCGVLQYKLNQPITARNLYPHNDSDAPKSGPCITPSGSCRALNTWNGPIIYTNKKYHMFNPLYKRGSLLQTQDMLHGIATNITGPYKWHSQNQGNMGSNPAFVSFQDVNTNVTKYSLWVGGNIYVSDDINGYFEKINSPHFSNPAPIFYKGKWYATDQTTTKILTTDKLGGTWTHYADINVKLNRGVQEDPFMWVDRRANWHIINHAYDTNEYTHCGKSTVSAHLFSQDNGKTWFMLQNPNIEPYSHTVSYEDGTTHTYTTLERPNCHFNEKGEMTHINLAADLMTQDAGCKSYAICPAKTKIGNYCACTNCKYADHAGTIIIALDVCEK
eukprot:g3473.t1